MYVLIVLYLNGKNVLGAKHVLMFALHKQYVLKMAILYGGQAVVFVVMHVKMCVLFVYLSFVSFSRNYEYTYTNK